MKINTYKSQIKVSISVLSQLIRYLLSLNVDINKLFKSVGIDPEIFEYPDTRIPIESYIAIEDEAVRVTGDPYFGLHMGEFFEPGNWSIIGYMMMNCRTLGEAFEKSGRYNKIIGNLIKGRMHIGFRKVTSVLSTPKHAPELSRHCFETVLSSVVRIMRMLTGRQINPLEVGFTYPKPESIAEYKRIFCSPVLFEQKNTYITMDLSMGNIPTLLPDDNILRHFENYAREYLSEIEGVDKTAQTVIKIILKHLDSQKLSIRKVAKEMSISIRTLQTRLKGEGKVFSELLQETRERLAKKYLCEKYTVEDITYMLGFSESSVFRKAFKKWSGSTPKEYREID